MGLHNSWVNIPIVEEVSDNPNECLFALVDKLDLKRSEDFPGNVPHAKGHSRGRSEYTRQESICLRPQEL